MKNKIRKNNSFKDGSDLPSEKEVVECYVCGNEIPENLRGFGTVDDDANIVDVCGNCFFGDGLHDLIVSKRNETL